MVKGVDHHPLLAGALLRRLSRARNGLDNEGRAALERRLMETQGKRLQSEVEALLQMIKTDYARVLAPLDAYRAQIIGERDRLATEVVETWRDVTAKQRQMAMIHTRP
jgi:hypothetical protein